MKNVSMWVMVLVLALVGSAIWYEVQYRQGQGHDGVSPIRHAASQKKADHPPDPHHIAPTNENGQLIG